MRRDWESWGCLISKRECYEGVLSVCVNTRFKRGWCWWSRETRQIKEIPFEQNTELFLRWKYSSSQLPVFGNCWNLTRHSQGQLALVGPALSNGECDLREIFVSSDNFSCAECLQFPALHLPQISSLAGILKECSKSQKLIILVMLYPSRVLTVQCPDCYNNDV